MKLAWLAALLCATPATSLAEPIEPPPESPQGADYAVEPGDTLEAGEVELGLGWEGASDRRPLRRRRVRFQDGELAGTVRDGAGDPLAGGAVEGRGPRHSFVAGRLAPRWGRGLVLGSSGDPWERAAVDRGRRSAWRGRAGEGAMLSRGHTHGLDLLLGRFARRDLAGVRARRGGLELGVLAARRGPTQSSLGWSRGAGQAELAIERGGRWRAEGLLERPLSGWSVTGCVRLGTSRFRSVAEPKRSGAASALILTAAGNSPAGRASLLAAAWRFRAGRSGARLALELRRDLEHGGALAWGFEEQHGVRRDSPARLEGLRQGAWVEWSGRSDPLSLSLRHETWGAGGGLREVVRAVSSARVAARGPRGVEFAILHAAFRVRRGESLYLAEAESDRIVLRALAGHGHRSRIELSLPAGRARLTATLQLATVSSTASAPRWTLEWARRSRAAPRAAS